MPIRRCKNAHANTSMRKRGNESVNAKAPLPKRLRVDAPRRNDKAAEAALLSDPRYAACCFVRL
jgi:hypothetical protein